MRRGLITSVIGAGLLLASAPAGAQVTTNDSALDQLAPTRPPASRPAPNRAPRPAPARPHTSSPASPAPTSSRPAPTAKPAIPATPPAILALPPAVAVPLAHPPPAPTVPLADDAPGAATPISNGLRITFGPDRADFSPATAAALAKFAEALTGPNAAAVNVFAYAAGSPDDPSTPRRLSLQRALAARAALMQAGIPSARIYPRALGPAGGDQPDRADVVIGTSTPPPAGHAG